MAREIDISEAAAVMGRKGGKIGGKAQVPKGFALMDPKRRAKIAKEAAATRWGTKKAETKRASRKRSEMREE